ncbi:MAG: hypothetical protein RL693_2731 [Verrucomicrobiota bacterium]|jgi:hypothetical protein
MNPQRTLKFLNVDLDIESLKNLRPLADELGEKVVVLHQGPAKQRGYILALESSKSRRTPDSAIRALCSAVARLSESSQEIWSAAHRKVFDIGYEMKTGGGVSQFELRPETVKLIASVGATVGITFYKRENLPKTSKR